MQDIIIIGAGPAGLTAALYALRANKKVLIFESKIHGGQIINAFEIENYPGIKNISGADYVQNLYEQVTELGCQIKYEPVIKIEDNKKVITEKGVYQAKAIIIATGLLTKNLNLALEEKFLGKGISYCATCDGNFYKNKKVAVLGGGNTALTDVIYLSSIASLVYLIHRKDTFKGDIKYIEEIKKKDNVKFILNSNVVELEGNDFLESVTLKYNQDQTEKLKIDGLFIAIGQNPSNDCFANLIKLDEDGYIDSLDGVHTNIKGIYVAGDIRKKELRQLVTAVSDGALAATMAIKEMN